MILERNKNVNLSLKVTSIENYLPINYFKTRMLRSKEWSLKNYIRKKQVLININFMSYYEVSKKKRISFSSLNKILMLLHHKIPKSQDAKAEMLEKFF